MTRKQSLEACVEMDRHGRILIPAAIQQAMRVGAGDVLFLQCRKGELRIQSRMQRIAKTQALVRQYVPAGVSLVDELIAERRAKAKREDAEACSDHIRHYRRLKPGAIR
jgi:bifunctional DNA-binding transcriptional regulator/antitoxin component of YhaV-PrlF toxin-antitoxin module